MERPDLGACSPQAHSSPHSSWPLIERRPPGARAALPWSSPGAGRLFWAPGPGGGLPGGGGVGGARWPDCCLPCACTDCRRPAGESALGAGPRMSASAALASSPSLTARLLERQGRGQPRATAASAFLPRPPADPAPAPRARPASLPTAPSTPSWHLGKPAWVPRCARIRCTPPPTPLLWALPAPPATVPLPCPTPAPALPDSATGDPVSVLPLEFPVLWNPGASRTPVYHPCPLVTAPSPAWPGARAQVAFE